MSNLLAGYIPNEKVIGCLKYDQKEILENNLKNFKELQVNFYLVIFTHRSKRLILSSMNESLIQIYQ